MLDINIISKRFFELSINGNKYFVEPCSLKTLKRFFGMGKLESEEGLVEYVAIMKKIIDKNRDEKQISIDTLDELSIDQINYILENYMGWMKEIKNSPNS